MDGRVAVTAGQLLGGKYRVETLLGQGGMATVLLAHHEELDQRVAIKILLDELAEDKEVVARFTREARAAAKIQSDHVVKVSDVGRFDGVGPYIVMEYLSGCDLGALLEKRGPLPAAQAVDYLLEAIDAIAEAHTRGIVHRDLKPQNLFLATRDDGSEIIKVLDFGISKVDAFSQTAGSLTRSQSMMGSPAYMSPEQLRSAKDVDGRADIWSLGVVLHELLTGTLPFEGETVGELFTNIVSVDPKPLGPLRPDLPKGLGDVVARCLRRAAADRFGNVAELARALETFGTGRAKRQVERASSLQKVIVSPPVAPPSSPRATPAEPLVSAIADTQGAWTEHARAKKLLDRAPVALKVVAAVLGMAVVGVGGWWLASGRSRHATAATDAPSSSALVSAAPPAAAPSSDAVAAAVSTPSVADAPDPAPPRPAPSAKRPAAAAAPASTTTKPPPPVVTAVPTCKVVTDYDSDGQPHFRKVCQ